MPDRKTILVTYDSGYGSTAEVAGQIEKSLCEADLLVDLQPVDNIKNLEQYSAVITQAFFSYRIFLFFRIQGDISQYP